MPNFRAMIDKNHPCFQGNFGKVSRIALTACRAQFAAAAGGTLRADAMLMEALEAAESIGSLPEQALCLRVAGMNAQMKDDGALAVANFSAAYELLEMAVVLAFYPDAGPDWLGMQGDPWDAQWDMTMAVSGAMLAQLLLGRLHAKSMERARVLHPRPPDITPPEALT